MTRFYRRLTLTGAGAIVAALFATGIAGAATTGPAPLPGHSIAGCVNPSANRSVYQVYTTKTPKCSGHSFEFSAASESQLSTVNTQVQANASAISGLQGVGKSTSANLTAGPIPTGGSFLSGAVEVGTLNLNAGTYLVNVSAKATPNASGDSAQIFPQFFVYNQVKNTNFNGNEFNIGAGALEPDGTNHDSYYSGSGIVIVPASGETLHVYAFGYDSNTGAGSYQLDSGSITAIALAG